MTIEYLNQFRAKRNVNPPEEVKVDLIVQDVNVSNIDAKKMISEIVREQGKRLQILSNASDMEVLRAAKRNDRLMAEYEMSNGISIQHTSEYEKALNYIKMDPAIRKEKIKILASKLENLNPEVLIQFPDIMQKINDALTSLPRL